MNIADMITPRIEINLDKIAHNAKKLQEIYALKGIDVIGVTKVVCGDTRIVNALIKSGINILADSRIANIKKMVDTGIQAQFLLLRTIYSQAEDVVSYAGISLNSELSVIKELSKYAVKQDTRHKIILMVELGDLREGIMPSDMRETVNEVIGLKGIELAGIGANLACVGGIKPDDKNMGCLSSIAKDIEDKFKLKLEFVSGGNSANYNWFMSTNDVGEINNLRLGESIFLGCETLERKPIPGLFTNAFTLIAEIIESKIKPSLPYGDVYQDAFGNTPKFIDHGLIRRAILGIGLQDVMVSGLTPIFDIDILGASSGHIIVSAKQTDLRVGNTVEFKMNYGALLSAMTSPYINKKYN
jgi:predicted amino acid racemase